jgi:cytochrome c
MRKLPLALAFTFAFGAAAAVAQTSKPGQPITESDITAWNIEALPDGKGLPPGTGTVKQGAAIYAQKCALCHGENGVNPRPGYSPLVGPSKFDRIDTMKTVPYYKFATTLFDVMRRSMSYRRPYTRPTTNSTRVCLHPLPQQDHRRERGDGSKLAAGEDAQPG